MIITGGENVYSSEVENVLFDHPEIAEAAVIGRPDPDWGHLVTAFVVVEGDAPSLDEVRDWVRRDLPVWNAPKDVIVVDALPKTALGKIRKSELR